MCYPSGVEGQVSAVFVSPAKSCSFTNRALDPRQVIGETVRLRFFAMSNNVDPELIRQAVAGAERTTGRTRRLWLALLDWLYSLYHE